MFAFFYKPITKVKKWWDSFTSEKIRKKVRLTVGISSLLWVFRKTGLKVVLQDFLLLLKNRFTLLGVSLGIAGILANTSLDESIHQWWIKKFKGKPWPDRIFKLAKKGGEYADLYIHFLLIMMLFHEKAEAENKEQDWIYAWACHSAWDLFEGTVLQVLGAIALGGARPEYRQSSTWRPFQSRDIVPPEVGEHVQRSRHYAVSGHAFQGAFPWLKMAEFSQSNVAKSLLFAFSMLPGLSRLQTESHYPSQVFLGWSFAYATATRQRTLLICEQGSPIIQPRKLSFQ